MNQSELYTLFLNGKAYDKGNWSYMQELMNDWVDSCGMYVKEEVTFKIVKNQYNKEELKWKYYLKTHKVKPEG